MVRTLRWSVLLILLLPAAARAQDEAADTTSADDASAWQTSLVGKLAATQAGYQNWQEGGVNTFAFSVSTSGKAERVQGRWQQTHESRLAYGLIGQEFDQDAFEFRKADDVIRLSSSLQYNGEGFFATFNPTISARARTQFTEGFNYDSNPFEDERPLPVKVSDFLSPGTFTQSLGLTYDPTDWFTQRVGVAMKETVVLIEQLRPLYGVDLDQTARIEAGLESRTEVDREILENVRLQSALGLFASFNQPDQPDALWENVVTMQVNKYLSVALEAVTLYDRDISNRAQFKEVLTLGVSVTLL